MSGLSLEWVILNASAADNGPDYTITRIKNHDVGTGSRGELASLRGDSHNFGWIQSGCAQSIAQFVGLALILSVFLLVTYQDIARLAF